MFLPPSFFEDNAASACYPENSLPGCADDGDRHGPPFLRTQQIQNRTICRVEKTGRGSKKKRKNQKEGQMEGMRSAAQKQGSRLTDVPAAVRV